MASLLSPVHAAVRSDAIEPYNATLDNFDYPFDAGRFTFESQGQTLSLAYMDVKPQGAPKAKVVLLHGKNFSGFYWERVASELVGMSYRVIIPDQIGFGKSGRPEHYQAAGLLSWLTGSWFTGEVSLLSAQAVSPYAMAMVKSNARKVPIDYSFVKLAHEITSMQAIA